MSGTASAATPIRVCAGSRAPCLALHFDDGGELLGVVAHHVGPDLHDVAEVQSDCGEGDAQVGERLPHLLGEIRRHDLGILVGSVLSRD